MRHFIRGICVATMMLGFALGSATMSVAADSACGTLVAFAGSGDPRYLLTLRSGTTTAQYRLSGAGNAPADIGDLFSAETPQLLTISGTQIATNTGSPQAINLTNFTVTRVSSCALPSTSTDPATTPRALLVLPIGILLIALTTLGGVRYAGLRRS